MNKGIPALAALALAACASTSFNTTWKAPDAQPLTFKAGDKVLAMVVSPNEATRRGAETALAAELNQRGLQGVPAYTVIPDEAVQDKEKAKQLVTASGAVGVVAMRVTGKEKEVSSSPGMYTGMYGGPHYGGFWGGYYGWGWGMAYSPGYLRTDTIVSVETLVYDLGQNKLVWAGQSDTMNPSKAESFIKELVDESVKEMKKQGLIS